MLSVLEPRGTVQVCATLTVSADTEDSITVTLATSDGSGTLIIIVILKNLYEKRLLIIIIFILVAVTGSKRTLFHCS